MDDGLGDGLSFLWGAGVGLFLAWNISYRVDTAPLEAPMIERCELFNTTLKSYDHYTAKCENGIEFNRGDL